MINYDGQGYLCLGRSPGADLSGMGGHQICSIGVVGHIVHRQKVVLSLSSSTSHYSPVGRVNDKPLWPGEAVSAVTESRANDQRQPRVSRAVIQPGSDR